MNDDFELPENFDWATFPDGSIKFVSHEIFNTKIYDRYRSVRQGDIVVDIGSSVGPFAYMAMSRGAKKIYCVEPSEIYIRSNIANHWRFIVSRPENSCVFINHAIGPTTDPDKKPRDEFNDFDGNRSVSTITFRDLISQYGIDKIDFLKIDCEGGEYDIFTQENFQYLQNNVEFMACEFHGRYDEVMLEKFHRFRKNILPGFRYHKICCTIDGRYTDLTDHFNQNDFNADHVIRRIELMIYISKTPMIDDPSVYILRPENVIYVNAPIA